MKKFFLAMAFAAVLLCGCQKINDLESRMNAAETDITALKSDLAKLQAAVEGNYAVSSYKATDNGYVLTLSNGSTITILNGANGANGKDGADGQNGKDGQDGKDGKDGVDGTDGDAFFQSVEAVGGYLVITLVDGSVYTLPLVDILSSITSIVFVPEYADGCASLDFWDGGDSKDQSITMSFLVSPASAAKAIAENKDAYKFSVLAKGVMTRADEFTELEVLYANLDGNAIKVFAYAGGLTEQNMCALQISSESNSIMSNFVGLKKECAGVNYGGVPYGARRMKDGKIWMTHNLRYIPEGYTPSSDLKNVTAGVYYPIVVNDNNTGAKFSDATIDIATNGYLYQSEVALGLKVGDIKTEEDAIALEGAQGICPDGWHIPTADDILGLVGKAVSPLVTNENAPYYDKAKKNGTMELLEADNFWCYPYGAVTIQDNTKTSATLMGWLKSKPEEISSGYYCGSTYAGVTYNTKDDAASGIKNVQFYGLMPMATTGTCNGSKLSYRIAASVRCVRNQ